MPIYGDGGALRDYVYVTDHCPAIDTVLRKGTPGGGLQRRAPGNEINTITRGQDDPRPPRQAREPDVARPRIGPATIAATAWMLEDARAGMGAATISSGDREDDAWYGIQAWWRRAEGRSLRVLSPELHRP